MSEARRHVVLVGGGHAHVQVLKAFAAQRVDARVTVVVDTPIAVYSGMVPGFVAEQYRAEELEIDVRPLARDCGAELVVARAVRVEADARRIHAEGRVPITYDVAAFDIGSTVAGLDLPGVREHAVPTRPIGLFVKRVAELEARARAHADGEPFRVVVVGGGSGGVELAFTMLKRLARVASRVEVTLLERGDRILRGYPASLAGRVHRRAEAKPISIRCSCSVTRADADAVTLDGGERVTCHALVWVTGAVSHPLFRDSDLPVDDRGFVSVRPTLQVEGRDELLASGDCGTLIEHPRTPKAGVYAVRQGPYVSHNIRALLAGNSLRSYTPQRDFLTLMNLGDGAALGAKWGRSFEGKWVMTLKDRIDRRFMRRFQMPFEDASMTTDADAAKREQIEMMYGKAHAKFPGIAEISAEELKQRFGEDGLVLVDVRTPEEQAVSMIPGAVTAVDFENEPEKYSDSKIVAYCTIGGRSGSYTRSLQTQGWDARNLKGAILSWTHVGGELTRDGDPTNQVHVHSRKFDLVAVGYEGVW